MAGGNELGASRVEIRVLEHLDKSGGEMWMKARVKLVDDEHSSTPQGFSGRTSGRKPGEGALTLGTES